jgi:hypothetical protein
MTTFGGMKYEDVVKMKKACDKFCKDDSISRGAFFWGYMQGVNAEREACAKIAENMGPCSFTGESSATAIRARGQE